MRVVKTHKCIAIRESDADTFAKKFDEALQGVRKPDIFKDYADSSFIAIVTWEEEEEVIETVRDEFHREGIRYVCGQCPYLEQDDDRRRKVYPCRYSEYGQSRIDSECCEMFYRLVKQGRVEVPI